MKKRTKSLIAAFCTMALCGSLIAGSTYALFTSSSNVNIAVTSGKVEVTAAVDPDSLELYSAATSITETDIATSIDTTGMNLDGFDGTYYSVKQTKKDSEGKSLFSNKGTAELTTDTTSKESVLTLTNMTPGDKVDFNIVVTNKSNVAIQYRVDFQSDEMEEGSGDNILMNALNFTVGDLRATSSESATLQYNGLSTYITEWTQWDVPANNEESKTVKASIELPLDVSNIYKNKSISIVFKVEAVQANANTGDNKPTVVSAPVVNADGTASTINASVNVDSTVTLDSSKQLSVNVSEISLSDIKDTTIAVETKNTMTTAIANNNNSSVTYNIDVTGIDKDNKGYVSVVLTGIEYDINNVYHSGNPMATSAADDTEEKGFGNGYYTKSLDKETNTYTLTIYTKSFSPFTVEYKYAGGLGTEANPYLVSTAAQLIDAAENGGESTYIRLINNIDNYLSKKYTNGYQNGYVIGAYLFKGQNIVIDLNNHNITLGSATYNDGKTDVTKVTNFMYIVNGSVELTGKGTIIGNNSTGDGSFGIEIYPEDSSSKINLTIGENVELRSDYGICVYGYKTDTYGYNNADNININVMGSIQSYNTCIYVNGLITDHGTPAKITISDKANLYAVDTGIYCAGYAIIDVKDSAKIVGKEAGIEIRAGELNIKGGTIESTATPTNQTPNGNGSTTSGAAVAVAKHNTDSNINVVISGGTLKAYTPLVVKAPEENYSYTDKTVSVSVSGGKFETINGGTEAICVVKYVNAEGNTVTKPNVTFTLAGNDGSEGNSYGSNDLSNIELVTIGSSINVYTYTYDTEKKEWNKYEVLYTYPTTQSEEATTSTPANEEQA